jgi:8-oxo-dGTP diphosphatase
MNAFVPRIRMVAVLIERDGRYLITQRSPPAVLAGLWEFPGCKVEAGETDETALRRELPARLAIDVDVSEELEDYAFPSADQGTTDLLLGISPNSP